MVEIMSNEELETLSTATVFLHDKLALNHSRRRKQKAKHWKDDRFPDAHRIPMTDTSFTKKRLHRYNRRHPEIPASLYHKNIYSLASVEYALT